MSETNLKSGSKDEFRSNWVGRSESLYNHWTPSAPKNQVQFAFKSHWEVFSELMHRSEPGRSLEVGAGRGSLSSHYAQQGWDVTLLDYSPEILDIAAKIFERNKHEATFDVGDANDLPYENDSFDSIASIGLLEHFEAPEKAIQEQWRVLKSQGWLFAYIVPEKPDNIQKYFRWVNKLLKLTIGVWLAKKGSVAKEDIYRNDNGSEFYLPIFEQLKPSKIVVSGVYSMPMISHSPEFPFSLLPSFLERVLVKLFSMTVKFRRRMFGRHGWLCSEKMGQALLVAVRKP